MHGKAVLSGDSNSIIGLDEIFFPVMLGIATKRAKSTVFDETADLEPVCTFSCSEKEEMEFTAAFLTNHA